MPAPRYQLVVGTVTGRDPRTSATHPWRRVARDGVVTVERSPGVSRDVASRPTTPEERDAISRAMLEAVEAGERCVDVGARYGRSKGSVIGAINRYRCAHGLQAPARTGGRMASHAERDARMVRAMLDGATAAEVAAAHEVTVGTVHAIRTRARRAGLLPPLVPHPTPSVPRAAGPRHNPILALPPRRHVPVCHEVERVGLLDVGPGQCRDLADDGLCCCAPTLPSSSWCSAHAAVYTRQLRRRAA